MSRWIRLGAVLVLMGAVLVERSLYRAIRLQAARDEAQPSDAIVVFGAAQYNGRPSPVFKARLDRAFDLEERGLAPLVITTGGRGGDTHFTEAGVGSDYLIQKGVAAGKVIAETQGETTFDSARAAARLLRQRGGKTCLAVSDGFHLYRIKRMFAALGIAAYGSPAPASPIEADAFQRALYSFRETLLLTLWYFGFRG